MGYAFPVNGVQRDTCSRCLFFGGSFDRQLITTVCAFPENCDFGERLMTPYSSNDEKYHPEYKELRQTPCPGFVDKGKLCCVIRSVILDGLNNRE